VRDHELSAKIAGLRERLLGHVRRAGDNSAELSTEATRLLTEQKTLQAQRPIDDAILASCKTWLAALPVGAVLEQVAVVVEDGLSLAAVRAQIKKMQNAVAALRNVPIPAPDIAAKVRADVDAMTEPTVSGIAAGEKFTSRWPTHPIVLLACFDREMVEKRLLAAVDKLANTHGSLAERQVRIAELEREIDRLRHVEEVIVVKTGTPRERGCPPWVVLGVKAVEARGIRAA
jgi:hypothetical protein